MFLITTLFSCTKDPDLIQVNSKKPILKSVGDGGYDLLGYGYNYKTSFLDPVEHTQLKVIDVERLISEQPDLYYVSTPNQNVSQFVAGSNAFTFSDSINIKFERSIPLEAFTFGVNTDISLYRTISSKNSYATFFMKICLKRMKLHHSIDVIKNYLTPAFVSNINSLSANEIIDKYGTHVFTDIIVGGKLEVDYRSFAGSTNQRQRVKAGVSSSVDKVFRLNTSATVDQTLATSNTNVKCDFKTIGGNPSYSVVGSINNETRDLSTNYQNWSSSVSLSNSVTIDVGDHSLIPIYKFVSDPVKALELKNAIEQYVIENRVTLVDGFIKGPFSLGGSYDKIISLDYNGDGAKDILLYSPGSGLVCLNYGLKNGLFDQVFMSSNGLGGYDFHSTNDQVLALDFNGDKKDDLMCYRPGMGAVYLMRSNGDGSYTTILASSSGLGGYNFDNPYDKAITLDYNGDNKIDLMFYRPGKKAVYLLRGNGDGTFTTVVKSSSGLAGFNFDQTQDLAIALDYNGDGKDDVMCYRPGSGAVYIQKSNGNGTFSNIYLSGNGIGGYNFDYITDKAISLDYNGDGKDDIMCYRPGSSACYLLKSNGNSMFATVYHGEGIAGFDLHDMRDRIISLDFDSNGTSDIIMYRPGMNCVFSAKSGGDGTYEFIYRE